MLVWNRVRAWRPDAQKEQAVGLDEVSVTLGKFDIREDDRALVREVGRLMDPEIEDFVGDFYDWLSDKDE